MDDLCYVLTKDCEMHAANYLKNHGEKSSHKWGVVSHRGALSSFTGRAFHFNHFQTSKTFRKQN